MAFAAALRSELTKLLTRKSTAVFAAIYAIITILPIAVAIIVKSINHQEVIFGWGMVMIASMTATFVAVAFGAVSTTTDIKTSMYAQAFLTQKSRWHWLVAKMLVTAVGLILVFLVALLVDAVLGLVFFDGFVNEGLPVVLVGQPLMQTSVLIIVMGLSAIIGSQGLSVALPLIWMAVVEGILGGLLGRMPFLQALMPFFNAQSLTSLFETTPEPLLGSSFALNGAILVAWIVAAVAGALVVNQRRDVK